MPYGSPLEAQIAKQATRAIVQFGMIEQGDRVVVGLSGGKDSWALLQILHVLRRRAPIAFDVTAVAVDAGFEGYRHDLLVAACADRGWPLHVEHTSITAVMDDLLDPAETPCSLCARLRRGVLHRVAREKGASTIALGHQADDVIETLLLNVFFGGRLAALAPRRAANDGLVVIRPLLYVSEDETRAYAAEAGLPVVACRCPSSEDLGLRRQRVKQLLRDLEAQYPEVKHSMLRAAGNVSPPHLLDAALTRRAAGSTAAGGEGDSR